MGGRPNCQSSGHDASRQDLERSIYLEGLAIRKSRLSSSRPIGNIETVTPQDWMLPRWLMVSPPYHMTGAPTLITDLCLPSPEPSSVSPRNYMDCSSLLLDSRLRAGRLRLPPHLLPTRRSIESCRVCPTDAIELRDRVAIYALYFPSSIPSRCSDGLRSWILLPGFVCLPSVCQLLGYLVRSIHFCLSIAGLLNKSWCASCALSLLTWISEYAETDVASRHLIGVLKRDGAECVQMRCPYQLLGNDFGLTRLKYVCWCSAGVRGDRPGETSLRERSSLAT